MLNLIKKVYDSLDNDCNNKHWWRFIFKLLSIILVAASMGLLLFSIAIVIINNIENIVITIGAIGCFFAIIFGKFSQKRVDSPQQDNTMMEYDPITLENTYKIVRKCLCNVLCEVSDIIKVRKPASLSQMDAPIHYDVVAKAPIYHFLATKLTNDVDLFNLEGILQNTIEQKLNNHELDGMPQMSYFYNGQAYPALMVDNVRELGNYIQIDIAIASEHYCKYRERRIYNNMSQSDSDRPTDREF